MVKNWKPAERKQRKRERMIRSAFSFVVLFPLLFIMSSTVLFLSLAMLPTLVSLIMDRKNEERYKWLCIGGTNFAGALFYLFQLWFKNATLSNAVFLFFQIKTVIVVYGCAAVGYAIYKVAPLVIVNFQILSAQRRVSSLRNMQKKLIEQWGYEVAETNEK